MRSLLATALVAFALVAVIQRRSVLDLRWSPNRHTWAAICAAALPAVLSTSALLFTAGSLPFEILLWVFIFGLCGFAIPWGYVLLVERSGARGLGVSRDRWATSVLISVLFAAGWALAIGVPGAIWLYSRSARSLRREAAL